MSAIYDNWERLVRAVLKREEIWEICHAPSRSSSPNSTSSDSNSSLTIHFDDHDLIIISPRAEVEESAYQSESEWVEEYEAGVQITLAASIDGNIGVKRASFSLGRFKKHEAVSWWVENRDKIHEKYNIQFLGKSEENTRPKRNENALSKNDSEENLIRSKDLEVGGSDHQFVDHCTWIELYEPGIYVTLGDFRDGTRYIKRIHFSRRRFEEHEADSWWLTNQDKVYEKYNIEQAALVPNAPQRFWYTLDLKKEEERKQLIAKTSTQAQVVRAAVLFQEAGQGLNVPEASKFPSRPTRIQDFGISSEELVEMARELDVSLLQQNGGVTGLAPKLKSNLEKGVPGDETDLIKRKIAFGSNTYPREKGRSFWRFVLEACRGTTLIILMVAAVASLVLGIKTEGIKEGWSYGGSISLAVLIVIIFTAASDYKQSLQFQNLNEEKQNIQTEVIRSGRRIKVSIFEIVVGDVVPLKIGHQVPADGLVISGHSLLMDESSITGDCKLVHKDSTSAPFLMSGCKVADGYGTMLVTSVGINTEWGLLMASISEDNGKETPLQVRLNGVATFIGIVGLAVAVVVLVVLVVRFFTGHTKDPDGRAHFTAGKTKVGDAIDGFIKIFTIAVTIVHVAVPEGFPLAVTLTLAYSMRKMMADKALVRRLSACETMGSATTICSDKTGTLTLNQMTVVEAYACGKKIDPPDNKSLLAPTVLSLLIEGVAQNTTGSVFVPEDGGAPEVSGSPTEKAILLWGANLGMDFEAVRSDSIIIHAFPFNSEIKRGGVALKLLTSEIYSDGIFYRILRFMCTGKEPPK